ncbi:MAG TPA: hypothetical protein VFZ66_20510 [Herpetosiphonaceae bacterium]
MAANIIRKQLNILLVLLILGVGFATTYGAAASGQKPRGDTSLDRRHEQVGTWQCSGITTAPHGTERPYYGLMENAWTLDGQWLKVHFVEQDPITPEPFIEDQYWGYTESTGKHARTIMTNDGSFGVLDSNGWQQDTMVWDGTYTTGGVTLEFTETIERIKAERYRWYGAISQDGTVLGRYDLICKRK